MADQDLNLRWLRLTILLVLAAGALYLLWLLLSSFLPALLTAGVAAALTFPLHDRIAGRIRQRDISAFLTTTLVFVLFVLPVGGLSIVLVGEIRSGIDLLSELLTRAATPGGQLSRWLQSAADYVGIDESAMGDTLAGQLRDFVGLLAGRTLRFVSGLGGWLLQGGAALFTLFYLLRDGRALVTTIRWLLPLDAELTDRLIRQARDVIFATVYGHIVVAIVQGGLGGLAFWLLGLPAAALWGSVMAVLSLLPVVGAFLVWLPAGVILILTGSLAKGIGLLIFGAVVISTIDNYLRALLVGERAHLHPLVVFFSVLGGLVVFGAIGIFAGPVLFVVALSLVEAARTAIQSREEAEELAAVPSTERPQPLTGSLFRTSDG